jgi:hypothetical protein
MNTEPQAYSVQEFVCKWRVLMSRVLAIPNFKDDIKDRVLIDVGSTHCVWHAPASDTAWIFKPWQPEELCVDSSLQTSNGDSSFSL